MRLCFVASQAILRAGSYDSALARVRSESEVYLFSRFEIMDTSVKTSDATDQSIARKIRLQRITKGLSQTELGDKIGITFQQIQKYEKGSNRVSAGRLKQIAEVLDVPVSFFFDGAPFNDASADNINVSLSFLETAAAVRLVRAFAEIKGVRVRRSIVALVEGIAGEQRGRWKRLK
jgi:transcriptional regulator with XRE-family HTH domain